MYYIGVDLGGMSIKAGIVDSKGKILLSGKVNTDSQRNYRDILKDMADLCKKLIEDAGLEEKDIASIGVGSPGIPDKKEGILISSNNLQFSNVPIRGELQKYFNLPIYLDNDANVAALAESVAGASQNAKHSVLITIGTGIGGGIIIDNKIYSGFNNAGSELGHMVIVHDGINCSCGRKGCFEKYASASALIEQTIEAAKMYPGSLINKIVNGDISRINAKTVFEAQKLEDATAEKVITQYIEYLADGIANIINILFPEIIVIGGGVGNEGENLFKPLRECLRKKAYTTDIKETLVKGAVMGNKAGIIGAAMLDR